jgi:hypothetical protein
MRRIFFYPGYRPAKVFDACFPCIFVKMNEIDLFEAVRREDVVIFAGAGFSKYAGYPLGGALAELFYQALTPEEQVKVVRGWPLDYLTEEVVRIRHGSRNLLNKLLDEIYAAPAESTEDHDLLATIPHFRTIITTNYDALFESAYGDTARLIFRDADIARWDDREVNILKIHGDLSDKGSIILTREDYSTFYGKDLSSPFWATIIKAIATKTILFLGYGYEDPNIWAIFKHVYGYIGENRKSAFFVGPNASEDKIQFLRDRGINYINRTGTEFLSTLVSHIEEHIFRDIEQKWVSPESFWKFAKSRKLEVPLKDHGTGFRMVSIQGLDGRKMNGQLKFSINPESDFPERHRAFMQNQAEELTLSEQDLKEFRMDIEGLKLYGDGELSQMSFTKVPKVFEIDLTFLKEGLEIRNLTAHVYASEKNVKIISKIHTLAFQMTFDLTDPEDIDGKWKMEHEPIYRTVSEEIEVHRFLKYFFSQKMATIYFKGGGDFSKQCPTFDKDFVNDADMHLRYFEGLKEVEQAFSVRFRDFYDINQETVDDLNWLLQVIRGEKFPKGDSMTMAFGELSGELIGNLDKIKDSDKPMEITMNSDSVMLLHDQRLPVQGLHIEIPDPIVTNLDDLRAGTGQKMEIKSKSGTIYHRYQIDPFPSVIEG